MQEAQVSVEGVHELLLGEIEFGGYLSQRRIWRQWFLSRFWLRFLNSSPLSSPPGPKIDENVKVLPEGCPVITFLF